MERAGAAATCDGKPFHGRAAALATGNALSPTVNSQSSIAYVERSENIYSNPNITLSRDQTST